MFYEYLNVLICNARIPFNMKTVGITLIAIIGSLMAIYGAVKLTYGNQALPTKVEKDSKPNGDSKIPDKKNGNTDPFKKPDDKSDKTNVQKEDTEKEKQKFEELKKAVENLKKVDEWLAAVELIDKSSAELKSYQEQVKSMRSNLSELLEDTRQKVVRPKLEEAKRLFEEKGIAHAVDPLRFLAMIKIKSNYPTEYVEYAKLIEEIREKTSPMVLLAKSEILVGEGESAQKITVEQFYCDKFEVTNEQYALFILITNHRIPEHWIDGKIPQGKEKHPVVMVTLEDTMAYAKWAGKRLPTEVELERAAKSKDNRIYPWGEKFHPKENEYCCNSEEYSLFREKADTMPVGSFVLGHSLELVSDLSGNVWEWTSTTEKVGEEIFYILRGGSFMTNREKCKSTSRFAEDPQVKHYDVGFRCVK